LAFAVISLNNPHIMLLDEPTNHLDMESIDGLINGLNNFNGCIVVITHDIYLIENIIDAELFYVENKKINKFNGNFESYCKKITE